MLKPVQRLDMGLSKLQEIETNMQEQAYSGNGMQMVVHEPCVWISQKSLSGETT